MGRQIFKANQHGSGQGTPRGSFKRLRQRHLGHDFARDDATEVGVTNSNRLGYSGLGEASGLKTFLQGSHDTKFVSTTQKAQWESGWKFVASEQNVRMSGWTYRDAFDLRYLEYTKRTKATAPEVATALGVAVDTLNSYRRKTKPTEPPPEVLVKAAQLFGCDVYEFMPNWGLLAAVGADPTRMDELQLHRVAEGARALTDPKLTPEELDLILRALKEQREMIYTVRRVTLGE